MHSALDAAVSDLLRVTAIAAPQDWEPYLQRRTTTLGEVRERGYEKLFYERLSDYLDELERESMLKRIARLYESCQPPSGFTPLTKPYVFSRERIEQLDKSRQQIIHGYQKVTGLPNIDDSLDFLSDTGLHLAGLVNWRYDVRIDPDEFQSLTYGAQK
jgi:hypothetical protein